MDKQVTVYAPATVANMVCGFDVLGFALHQPADEVTGQVVGDSSVGGHAAPAKGLFLERVWYND